MSKAFWSNNNPTQMHYQKLRNAVSYYKSTKEGTRKMCRSLEEMRNETAEITRKETLEEVVRAMLSGGMTVETISTMLNLPFEEVQSFCEA